MMPLATNYFAVASGSSNVSSTWSLTRGGSPGAGVPGPGDCAEVSNGFTLTVPTGITQIIGPASASAADATGCGGGTALHLGNYTSGTTVPATSTASVVLAPGAKLVLRGHLTHTPSSDGRTPGFCMASVAGGGELQFDSSQTSPTSTQYTWGPQSANNVLDMNAVLCATGTAGNTALFDSNANGGNAYATENGGIYAGWYHNLVYADFVRMGDSTNPPLEMDAYTGDLGIRTPAIFDHVRWISGGSVQMIHGISSDSLLISANQCITPVAGCFYNASATPTSPAYKTITSSSSDLNAPLFSAGSVVVNWKLTNNFNLGPNLGSDGSGGHWLAFDRNVSINNYAFGTQMPTWGDVTNSYYLGHLDDVNLHGYQPDLKHGSALGFTGNIFDQDAYVITSLILDTGNMVLEGGTTNTISVTLANNLVLPGADRVHTAPGNLFTLSSNQNVTVAATNNTIYDMAQQNNQGIVDVEELTGFAGNVPTFAGNIAYSDQASPAFLFIDTYTTSCVANVLTPTGATYNAAYNTSTSTTGTCATNAGRSFLGDFTAVPDATGHVTTSPAMVDDDRGLVQSGIKFFGETACPAWVSGTTYTYTAPGATCVSVAASGYYAGTTINYNLIATNTASSGNQPGVQASSTGANWRTYWEPSGFLDYRNSLYAGTSYSVPFIQWIRNGMAPTNPSYLNASAPSGYIGAVYPAISGAAGRRVVP